MGSPTVLFVGFKYLYRPQRSWGKVIFSEACVNNSVHRGGGGSAWLLPGGVHGCSQGKGGMRGCSGGGGLHGCSQGGVRGSCGGGAWLLPGGRGRGCAWDTTRYGDTIDERAVRTLLECILVQLITHKARVLNT